MRMMDGEEDLTPEEQQLVVQQAILGKQIEEFFSSDVGKYLLRRADIDREDALLELARCDPEDAKAIRGLQNKVLVSEKVRGWLEQAVLRGLQAIEIIDERS